MRRGLMAWDPEEIPVAALTARVLRLQDAMQAAGLDAFLLYTNFIRPGAVSYLTAFSPYWADGVLLVPVRGEPLFATTLSKRVGSWIQTVKPVGDLVNSPAPGTVLGKRMAESGARRVAILELDAFPAGLFDDIAAALPGVAIVAGSDVFASARAHLDDVERRLLNRADAIARDALANLSASAATNAGHAVGEVEKHARLAGAEEVYVAIAPDLDADRRFVRLSGPKPLGARFAIRATVAYKGTWIRRIRTYSRNDGDGPAVRRAEAWFSQLLEEIDLSRTPQDQIVASVATLSGARLINWLAEAPVGTHPLTAISTAAPALILTLGLDIGGIPWCGAGLVLL